MRYVLNVKEDAETGDLYLDLPDDLIEELGWEIGDNLTWKQKDDETWTLSKSEK